MSRPAFRFDDEDVLLIAISSGWVPAEVSAASAYVAREEGAIVVAPSVPFEGAKLRAHGVASTTLEAGEEVLAWAAAIAARRAPSAGLDAGTVTFLLPHMRGVAHLAGELLRLGCDRLELRAIGERAMLRAVAPPFHTVARALDRVDGLRVFRAVAEGVLVELGFDHPLAARIRPRAGTVLLIAFDGFEVVPDGAFEDLLPRLELAVASEPRSVGVAAEVPRISVPLRLARAARRADATLWIVSHDALSEVERFVRSTPEHVATRYLFAVTNETPPRVILRTRPGDRGTAEPMVSADARATHPQIPNLYVPVDATIEPPLRHERLRALLAPDPAQLSIVRRDAFAIERIADDAFRPLSAFVDYLVDRASSELSAWVESATFDFASFVVDDAPPVARESEPAPKARKSKSRAAPAPPEPAKPTRSKSAKPKTEQQAVVVAAIPQSEAAEALSATEAEFLALDAPADDQARQPLWLRIAELNATLGRTRDAAHAFAHALWEQPENADAIAARWAEVEGRVDLAATLSRAHVSVDEARAVAAHVISTDANIDVPAVLRFLDGQDAQLDIRSMWLARVRIARRVDDALMLARARDRALARLVRGLSVERDVPTFLRLFDRGSQNAHRLAEELDSVRARVLRESRTRSPVEAKPALTMAYVELSIAWGLARLGSNDRARELAGSAPGALDLNDPVHGYLARAYAARIDQALAGEPPHTPLPPKVGAELNALEKFLRYKVDRLRQSSTILEPLERLDPIGAFQRGDTDPRGDMFASLRALEDRDALAENLERVAAEAAKSAPERRARLFDGVLDFLPQVQESRAIAIGESVLARVADVPPLPRAQLFEEVLRVGGHFGNASLVRASLDALLPLVRSFDVAHVSDLAQLLGGAVRALRRVGLRDDAIAILRSVASLAKGDSIPSLVARVQVAGGLSALGLEDEARPVFERALDRLAGDASVPDRLVLTRAVARGVATAESGFALAVLRRLEAQLPKITDSFNTNSHFCLSVIAFAEALIMGYVSDDLALGDRARRFFDEDEHLVRRRIHRELRG